MRAPTLEDVYASTGVDPHLPNPSQPKLIASHEGEHHGDHGDVRINITRSTYIYALCAAVNSCSLGYDIGVNTNAGVRIQQDFGLTNVQVEIFVGSINFWSMFGAIFAHYITDRYGRRRSFVVAAIGFIVGVIVIATAWNYTILMIGRVFVGLGIGFGLAVRTNIKKRAFSRALWEITLTMSIFSLARLIRFTFPRFHRRHIAENSFRGRRLPSMWALSLGLPLDSSQVPLPGASCFSLEQYCP